MNCSILVFKMRINMVDSLKEYRITNPAPLETVSVIVDKCGASISYSVEKVKSLNDNYILLENEDVINIQELDDANKVFVTSDFVSFAKSFCDDCYSLGDQINLLLDDLKLNSLLNNRQRFEIDDLQKKFNDFYVPNRNITPIILHYSTVDVLKDIKENHILKQTIQVDNQKKHTSLSF